MSGFNDTSRQQRLRDAFPDATRVDLGSASIDHVSRLYEGAGYDVGAELRGFLEEYREFSISWMYREIEVGVQIDAEEALSFYPGNIRIFSQRVGRPLIPVGSAFATEEVVLIATDGDVYLAGDAGMQYVGNGFMQSMQALISGTWDKTFF
ncbi:SUKH-3 domain-containing protein [Streptomyces sp. ISL-43]|uniref:SUKH-3 domain-containing protein n=1 Tax=Streptomyces sp. ISL-43 TaxID=2819183 RepID=UPI001BEA3F64|nr:SUKH-3 domain-containing protein [Streptomyces sp. ISL-43]MBT2452947.1 SUKH-3 domain-containing protein [Streptomyces sp. ISL-43]